jgi:hypothetical protein
MARAGTGIALPFSANGPTGVVSKEVSAWSYAGTVASSSPGAALPMIRAARLIASPLTE